MHINHINRHTHLRPSCLFALLLLFLLSASIANAGVPQPDLTIIGAAAHPYIENHTFTSADCEVVEGCVVAGTRRLLRFNTETHNIGTGDLHLGDPALNPLFYFSDCHQHYHFDQYMVNRLLGAADAVVAVGNKTGFCLLDSIQVDINAAIPVRFNCDNQGIHAGWGDVYTSNLPCQFIDITDVPPGTYTMEMTVDPQHLLGDADYTNNTSRIEVVIPDPPQVPTNDACADAIPICPGQLLTGSTEVATNDGNSGCGNSTGRQDVWYSYTAAANGMTTVTTCGSSYDTVISVHTGCPGTAGNQLQCNDDTLPGCDVAGGSTLSTSILAGETLYIRVSGYGSSTGSFQIQVFGPDCFTPSPTPTPAPSLSPTPPPTGAAAGDFDNSGCTDLADFLYILDNWFETVGDNLIDIDDFLALLDNWTTGPTCP